MVSSLLSLPSRLWSLAERCLRFILPWLDQVVAAVMCKPVNNITILERIAS